MRISTLIITLLAALAIVPSSNAATLPDGVPLSWCDHYDITKCYTWDAADPVTQSPAYQTTYYRSAYSGATAHDAGSLGCGLIYVYPNQPPQGSSACLKLRGTQISYTYAHTSTYNYTPYLHATYGIATGEDGSRFVASDDPQPSIQIDARYQGAYCPTPIPDTGGTIADTNGHPGLYESAEIMMRECGMQLQGETQQQVAATTTSEPATAAPAKPKCRQVRVRGIGMVDFVVSKGASCADARQLSVRVPRRRMLDDWACSYRKLHGRARFSRCVRFDDDDNVTGVVTLRFTQPVARHEDD